MRPGQPIELNDIPEDHRRMSGYYTLETEDGVRVDLYVRSGTRQMSGTELMRAHIQRAGRPMSSADMRVDNVEIYLLIANAHRKDIKLASNGGYQHGRVFSRSLREAVEDVIQMYLPRPPREEIAPPAPKGP